jgi:hypothetical protein
MALRRGFSFPCALRPPSSICFCLLSESSFQRILLLALGGCVGSCPGWWIKGDSESRVRTRESERARPRDGSEPIAKHRGDRF